MAHNGQYQCQRGCKEKFKTPRILDEHHKSKHMAKPSAEFKCDKCISSFTTQNNLRLHMNIKHVQQRAPPHMKLSCEYCGLITNGKDQLENHKVHCNAGYTQMGNKICKYFDRGGCFKGESCRFTHLQESQSRSTPHCRNGSRCNFLARGSCFFFHSGVGTQQPRNQEVPAESQNSKTWCKYLEDCDRVPNCPFLHAEEDFPKLSKANHPPLGQKSRGWWQNY